MSATSSFQTAVTPASGIPPVYPIHSWAGGAVLWATSQVESGRAGYYFDWEGLTYISFTLREGQVKVTPSILKCILGSVYEL